MPHFQLMRTGGEALGPVELGPPDWPPGSVIERSGEPDVRVGDVIESDDGPELFTVLVVEEV